MTRWLLCVWLLSGVTVANAEDVFNHPQSAQQLLQGVLAQPAAQLKKSEVMRAQFVYRKFLKDIPQPLVSHGELLLIKGVGINWHTRMPFDSEFVLGTAGMSTREAGQRSTQTSSVEQPAVREVARIFLALMSLDLASLQNSFTLYGLQQQGHWQVGMRPLSAAVSAVFSSAVLEGESEVQRIVLNDATGDHTEITFASLQYGATASAADRAAIKP